MKTKILTADLKPYKVKPKMTNADATGIALAIILILTFINWYLTF